VRPRVKVAYFLLSGISRKLDMQPMQGRSTCIGCISVGNTLDNRRHLRIPQKNEQHILPGEATLSIENGRKLLAGSQRLPPLGSWGSYWVVVQWVTSVDPWLM